MAHITDKVSTAQ